MIAKEIIANGLWANKYAKTIVNTLSVIATVFVFAYNIAIIPMGTGFINNALEYTFNPVVIEYGITSDMFYEDFESARLLIQSATPLLLFIATFSMLHNLLELNVQRVIIRGKSTISSYWTVGIVVAYVYGFQMIWLNNIGAGIIPLLASLVLSGTLPLIYAIKHFIIYRQSFDGAVGRWLALARFLPTLGSILVLFRFKKHLKYLIFPAEEEYDDDEDFGDFEEQYIDE